jgi:2-methylisocitrate lyase-like PEP mutase family enzyme
MIEDKVAAEFHRLHERGLLILPNAWDAGSARLIENAGARAIATSSAAVAWSHGYPDGDKLPVELLARTVAEIVRAVRLPVSVDFEGGYDDDRGKFGSNLDYIVACGAVGINLEDGTKSTTLLARKIRAAKGINPDLFVNARIDVYLKALVPEKKRLDETLKRARKYRDAGADGIFVPGLTAPEEIQAIVSEIDRPLNLLVRPSLPDARTLESWGVRRLSAGSWIAASAYARIESLAANFLKDGRSAPVMEGARGYADTNLLFMS